MKLIRWKNVLMVGFTQILAVYGFLNWPLPDILVNVKFHLTILSTMLITAAGYIINDYLDVKIDQINKPNDVMIGNAISRKTAIKLHVSLTLLALLAAFVVSKWLFVIELLTAITLVKYSSSFKKQFLIGNLIVAILCGLILPVLFLWSNLLSYKLLMAYGIFAAWITLVREIIKDIEDMRGDRMENCKTIPIVLGVKYTKNIIYLITLGLMITSIAFFLLSAHTHLYTFNLKLIFVVYFISTVELPLIFMLYKLKHAVKTNDYTLISRLIKIAMLGGIISMIFFRF